MELTVRIKKRLHRFTLNADIETKSSIALLGASGSGKSMTLKCIAGIEKPDSGVIILNGRTLYDSEKGIDLPPQKRKIGYLFQNYALFPNMTVRQNIEVAAKEKNNVDKLISDFYLNSIANKYPDEISGGQQQRTALARIIASKPEAILLDEPFSAIDSYLKWKLEMTVSDTIKNFGGLNIMVTHDRNEAYRNCGGICIINDGRTEKILNTKEFMECPKTVGAARISGCKNIYRFEKTQKENVIFVPSLNIYLKTDEIIRENCGYVGLRAHYFRFDGGENEIVCETERIIEDVFSTIIMLKPVNCKLDSELIRIETDKKKAAELISNKLIKIYIEPKNVLLLE